MINSSSMDMQTRAAVLPSVAEKVEMSVKMDRRPQSMRTASKGIATSTAVKIRFSPAGTLLNSEALLAARQTRIAYIKTKIMKPTLIIAFPELRSELLSEVRRVAPTIKRTSEAKAPIWRHWITRLRRDDAVALLPITLYLLALASAVFRRDGSAHQAGDGKAYRRPTIGSLGRIEWMPLFPKVE